MIHIRNIPDCHLIIDNPKLSREVISCLLYCRMELLEYDDDPEDQDFNFSVLVEEDHPMLQSLGPPEETVQINIMADGMVLIMYRIVYPTEVIFIPAEIYDLFSF